MEPSPPASPLDPGRIARRFTDPTQDRVVKRGHLRHFADAKRVLDLGCGEGAFLDLLAESGIEGTGLEASEAAAAVCQARGHEVELGDVITVLRQYAEGDVRFDGVFASHLVEHLQPEVVAELLALAVQVLVPGGTLVVVTPNTKNLLVLTEVFWLDPTHVRPYPRALLECMGSAAGLDAVASYDDPASVPHRGPVRRWLARLRSWLSGADRSGPMDSVVVFVRR